MATFKHRRDAEVKLLGDLHLVHDGVCRIEPGSAPGYDLFVGPTLVAKCEYAKRLSDWAFYNGAVSVRHGYDLRLSDWEP